MSEGQTEPLFPARGEMMEFELWEKMQCNMLHLVEAKITISAKAHATEAHPWVNARALELFLNEHRCHLMMNNLDTVGFQANMDSAHGNSLAMSMPDDFLTNCRQVFAVGINPYLVRLHLHQQFQRSNKNIRAF